MKYGPNAPFTQISNGYCGGWEGKFYDPLPADLVQMRSEA